MSNPSTVIIGRGKVGQSFAQLFSLAKLPVQLLGRSLEAQQQAVSDADLTVLCVTDNEIEPLCSELAPYFKRCSTVAHCSGALDSEILASARQRECQLVSMHPLNTFPSIDAALTLFNSLNHNTTLFTEGDADALSILLPLTQQLGFRPLILQTQSKASYHAACVFACNYLSTLMELSQHTAEQGGLGRDEFWQAIQPLIQATLNNISEHGTAGSLSGPIARGDTSTVEKHLLVLNETRDSYKHLGLETLRLAAKRGELSEKQLATMETLLS